MKKGGLAGGPGSRSMLLIGNTPSYVVSPTPWPPPSREGEENYGGTPPCPRQETWVSCDLPCRTGCRLHSSVTVTFSTCVVSTLPLVSSPCMFLPQLLQEGHVLLAPLATVQSVASSPLISGAFQSLPWTVEKGKMGDDPSGLCPAAGEGESGGRFRPFPPCGGRLGWGVVALAAHASPLLSTERGSKGGMPHFVIPAFAGIQGLLTSAKRPWQGKQVRHAGG